jgi:hypothetical protein
MRAFVPTPCVLHVHHVILLDLTNYQLLSRSTKYEAPHNVISSTALLLVHYAQELSHNLVLNAFHGYITYHGYSG